MLKTKDGSIDAFIQFVSSINKVLLMCFNLISAFLLANLGCFTEAISHSTIVSFRLGWNRTFNKLLLVGVLLFFHTHNVRVTIILDYFHFVSSVACRGNF